MPVSVLDPLRKAKHRLTVRRMIAQEGTFTFAGEEYRYVHRPYNTTWLNERPVELPIALRQLERHAGQRVLEVGNVLGHYGERNHDVVDKYEPGPGVVNVDIVDYRPSEPYDLIVSISTIEHVGWDSQARGNDGLAGDEEARDPDKIPAALEHLSGLLAPGGTFMVTVPFGWNAFLDGYLADGSLPFTETRYLRRIAAPNIWEERSLEDVAGTPYVRESGSADALAVGFIRR